MITKFKLGLIYRQYEKLFYLIVKKLSGFRRTSDKVKEEYGKLWFDSSRNQKELVGSPQLYLRNGQIVFLRRVDRKQILIQQINDYIKSLQPRNILEVGSGAGINLISLALLNPDISFVGIELTKSGVDSSEFFLKNPPIQHLSFITGLKESDILERLKKINIRFVNGDMKEMPFGNGEFDLIYSYLAIEQLPDSFREAFREIRRVMNVDGSGIFIEAFKEAQSTLTQVIFLWAVDYFRWSLKTLEEEGLKIERFNKFTFQNFTIGLGLVMVSKKNN